ncbi:MAG TPA: membrane protein insertase YidC [Woeseiaceae bacterium]|nr:membrane protein insertase YidC [Woeseiaceae bacterium]
MDNQRLLVWAAFGLMLWITYQAWMQDYGPRPAQQTEAPAPVAESPPETGPELPDLAATPGEAPALEEAAAPDPARAGTIRVSTDVLHIEISEQGGTLQRAQLIRYPVAKNRPNDLVELLSPESANHGLLQTGLRSSGNGAEANHLASFSAPAKHFELGDREELLVPLTWHDERGVTVEKVLRFTRGSYRIDVTQTLINNSETEWRGAEYAQIRRRSFPIERSMFDVDSYSFDGPVIFNGEKSEKLDRDDLMSDGPMSQTATNGWIASIQHHFLSAAAPTQEQPYNYNISVRDNVAILSLIAGATTSVEPGGEHAFETVLFVGPKLQNQLEEISPQLKLTVDYGWLTILSQPLFWLLSRVYSFVGNWGLAIVLVTILIKIAFYKLTEASGRSMAKMREIQPRMKALQDRYKDDRQQLSQAMMDLYKREKVNPAAGCLPILIQMPFFLAFYWVLLESVEMRQAPFALWITDLSSRDPYFILPLIMGAAMFFQQKLNPAPADPVQAKVMQIMPVVFTGFFAFFPSGLVLYWVTNTLLSIAQQWRINKVVHQEALAAKGVRKKNNGEE